jgi:aminoglycoside 3-N-acetyltransferase
MDELSPPTLTPAQLTSALRALGVQPGQVVMLHASVKAIGWIMGGPRQVLVALLDVLGPDGTLMMLASWEGNPYHLARWPPEQQQQALDEWPAFDPATSPADHREMSILAEYLRTWPGAARSRHPMASFVAVGAQARWLTERHPLQYGMGPDTPLARLCALGGQVLLLGPLFTNLTVLHHAEHLAAVPHKRLDRYRMPILEAGRRVWVDIEEYDTTNGIADFDSDDDFRDIGRAYVDSGRGRHGMVGAAPAYLLDATGLVTFGVRWMEARCPRP